MILGLACMAEAEGLPLLRVDPALLNPPAAKSEPLVPPSAMLPTLATTPEAPPRVEVTPVSAPASAASLAAPTAPKVEPAAAATKPANAWVAAAKSATPVAPTETAKLAPAKLPEPPAAKVLPVAAESAQSPAVTEATAVAATQAPPVVEERPALPPLYSAHVAAGVLPASPAAGAAADNTTYISADHIHGRNDVETIAEGNAELRKGVTLLTADRMTYQHLDDEVDAFGSVRLERNKDWYTGPRLHMRVGDNVGYFEQPHYSMTRTTTVTTPNALLGIENAPISVPVTGRGEAERIDFEGENLYRLSKATYSTCKAGNQDWYATAGDLNLDYNREVAEGHDGKVVFKGVPILYSPWLSFSLDNQRKSGLLTPTFGTTNTSGSELSIPWYWNIAPDMDATITPRLMQKRGAQVTSEIRYLMDSKIPNVPPYANQVNLEYLPDDLLEHKSRYGYSILHQQTLGNGFTGSLNMTGVSDGTYFRDLSKPGSIAAQTYLLRQGQLTYGASWWSASLLAQRYQVLQDPSLPPVGELYRRLPQFNLSANRYDLPLGSVFNFTGEMVRFGHPTDVTGQRNTYYPQISLPLQTSFLQVTPKLGLNVTRYQLSNQAAGVPSQMDRNLPVFSVDSSVVFERDTELLGHNLTQTLEPRLYYLYVPYRDQSQIPVFDTALADFNFAQIFAENRYGGGDRFSDANQLTATATSRIIDPATGAELVRGLIGQRYYFTTQHVTLPGEVPRTGRSADILAALSGQVMPKTYVDTGWQYNPRDARTERLTIGGRYQPEIGKVFNAGYRYTRDVLGQIDVSAQWPLGGGWNVVGRYDYSTKDNRVIESVGGVEYNGGCWVGRIVMQRIATLTQQQTTSLFFQLELNGFSRIGSNPIDVLKRNIPGYGPINQFGAESDLMPK